MAFIKRLLCRISTGLSCIVNKSKILSGLFISVIIFSGCSSNDSMSPDKLKELITGAASGNASANDSLGGLFSISPSAGMPREFSIDTLTIAGVKYFGAAVGFPDPLNNRFALYDEFMNCYVIDRSLNGKLKLSAVRGNNFNYFSVEENFFSNDSVELKRFSMYRGDTSGFTLAFRTFTMMRTKDTVFLHNLYEITPEMIRTNISAPIFSGLNNLNDDYFYDKKLKVYYVRRSIYFDEFVTDFINSISDTAHKFIYPYGRKNNELSSVYQSTEGVQPDYYLSLDDEWKELRNKSGSMLLRKDLTGSKFVNDRLRTDIYVFRIPFTQEAEEYVKADFNNSVSGNYTVRYSSEYEKNGLINKYFEYTCRTKKFLLILSAATDIYLNYKQEYSDIVNTFYINC